MTQAPGKTLTILGIETSCDETAAAVVSRDRDGRGQIRSNIVRSQWAEHEAYGGVVPEIAARAHLDCLDDIMVRALTEAGVALGEVDAIAATAGPGLLGGLIVGLTVAKGLALSTGKALYAINHLEAHALTAGLTDGIRPPYLLLLISGGHTQTILVRAVGRYERIGSTIDDALGEAFDKIANLLGLGAPGGPAVEAMARNGDAAAFDFPRPMRGRAEPHFSFAGLKTAVRRVAEQRVPLSEQDLADICASFQSAVCDTVIDRCACALDLVADDLGEPRRLIVAGGVAANQCLRSVLTDFADDRAVELVTPPIPLCGDNAAMIAWAAAERVAHGFVQDGFEEQPRPRWPLDELALPVLGAGAKGAKA